MRALFNLMVLSALMTLWCFPLQAAVTQFRAGAARINITPPADAALPMSGYGNRTAGHSGIRDSLYVRAIVMDDGRTKAAIVVVEISDVGHALWDAVAPRIAALGMPLEHILLAGTHTHSGPNLGQYTGDDDLPAHPYYSEIQDRIVAAARMALDRLQPARVGAGKGTANVNCNRRARLANGGWWLGYNPDGPADKTVHVLKIESLSGQPIAILTNYGVHATILGSRNLRISGDIAGSTSRFVESHFGGKVIVPWTSSTGGDTNPIYRAEDGDETRVGYVDVLGQILGEETIRVAESIRTRATITISGAQQVVTCPGKKSPPGPRYREDAKYVFLDGDPVDIRLTTLMLGNIAVTGVSGEVLTNIGLRLRRESPFQQTFLISHCNGYSGYLPADADYDTISYEIVSTHVKRGFAEQAIVGGLLEMMR